MTPQKGNENSSSRSKVYIIVWIAATLGLVVSLSYLIYLTPSLQGGDPQNPTSTPQSGDAPTPTPQSGDPHGPNPTAPNDNPQGPTPTAPNDDPWFSEQDKRAVSGLLANLGRSGAKSYGAIDGVLLDSAVSDERERETTMPS